MFERVEVCWIAHCICVSVCVCVCVLQVHCMLNQTDIHISYLPLAHMFERVVEVCMYTVIKHMF